MFIKLQIKISLFVLALFFVTVNVYAANVYNYSDLASAVSSSQTIIAFATNTINFTGNPIINYGNTTNPINVYGNNVTLNGGGSCRLFNFSNANVLFHNDINFINGSVTTNGGAINNISTSTITFLPGSYEVFTMNQATAALGYGGAIYNDNNSIITFSIMRYLQTIRQILLADL